jgi:LDH2 family malate/lactate/ureidoglycolate dehydrogenase
MSRQPAAASKSVTGGQVVGADDLRRFAAAVLERNGMRRDDAAILADAMVWSDLRGIAKQGTLRLPLVVERVRAGGTNARGEVVVERDSASFATIAGGDQWGPVLGVRAMRLAIEKARATGLGAVVVRDTTFAFALGYYPTLTIAEGMIGLAINDCLPLMAPPGGTKRVIGNQAFAMGCPAARHLPILLDTALSATTWTAIHDVQERGGELADGLAVGPDERPTTDPALALAGRLLPLGGHKGFGIAFLFEILTGILSGGELFGEHLRGPDDLARPMGTSLFMLALDPRKSMSYERFLGRVDGLIDQVLSSPTESGVERIYTPGQRSFLLAEQREREGIPLAPTTIAKLREVGEALGVDWPGTRD